MPRPLLSATALAALATNAPFCGAFGRACCRHRLRRWTEALGRLRGRLALREEPLARELDIAPDVYVQHLHLYLLPDAQHVARAADALVRDFRHVQQPLPLGWEELEDCAILFETKHARAQHLADGNVPGDGLAHQGACESHALRIRREDGYLGTLAILAVLDRQLGAAARLNVAHANPLQPDELPNEIGHEIDCFHTRRVVTHALARRRNRGLHSVQDLVSRLQCGLQR
mmetsp:Transcript_464/g.1757  ORF Transcript_464/g.1757 Transcript_464/m.1757 type:complete len:230 (-) Transcript_464:1661-2350(-)